MDIRGDRESGCESDPVIVERTSSRDGSSDGVLASKNAGAGSHNAVVGPERHHGIDVSSIRGGEMESLLKFVEVSKAVVVVAIYSFLRDGPGNWSLEQQRDRESGESRQC